MEYTVQNIWRPVIQGRHLGQRGTGSTGSAAFGLCDPGRCSASQHPRFLIYGMNLTQKKTRKTEDEIRPGSANTEHRDPWISIIYRYHSLFMSVLSKRQKRKPPDGSGTAEPPAPEGTPQTQELTCIHSVVQPHLSCHEYKHLMWRQTQSLGGQREQEP